MITYLIRIVSIALIIFLGLGVSAFSQIEPLTSEKISKIDAFVEERMAALQIPGVSIALIENGDIVHVKGFGVTTPGGVPVTANTPFQTGSVSKSFTALAIMQLVEAGKLRLDDPVISHIPWFGTAAKSASDKITVRHLLSHRSGISTFDGNHNQDGGSDQADAMEVAVRSMSQIKLISPPGQTYHYSNANYQILGYLIETLTSESYEVVLDNYVLQQNIMPDSFISRRKTRLGDIAQGHRYWLGKPRLFKGHIGRATLAQGGVTASSADLAAYLALFMDDNAGLVFTDSETTLTTPYDETAAQKYALGWMVYDFEDYRLVFHTGSSPGFQTVAGYSPDERFGYVVLANTNDSFGSRNVTGLIRGVGRLVMDRPLPNLSPSPTDKALRLGILTFPGLLVIWIGWFFRKYKAATLKPKTAKPLSVAYLIRIIVPSFVLFALAYVLLVTIPQINGAPMSAIRLFNPDVAMILKIGGFAAIVWAIMRVVLWHRFARSPKTS